jgi:hypothetical protein
MCSSAELAKPMHVPVLLLFQVSKARLPFAGIAIQQKQHRLEALAPPACAIRKLNVVFIF